jgi:hypothetical protein
METMPVPADIEDEINRRVQQRGHETFTRMQARITELQAENASLKAMLGIPADTAVLVAVP